MTTPRVSLADAFGSAWETMMTILFRPFDFGKWLALGFTAWLAGLASNGGGGGGSGGWNVGGAPDALDEPGGGIESFPLALRESLERGLEWLSDNPLWLIAGTFGCALLIMLFLVILWVSSRGKFMFLDNVVHDRAEVVAPWKRYRRLANSHFSFQLVFSLLLIGIVLGSILAILGLGGAAWQADIARTVPCLLLALGGLALLAIILSIAFIQYFLDAFVVPIMHRYDLTVLVAWSRFGEIFRRHPGTMLFSGLFLFVLVIAAGMAVVLAGFLSCCLGFVLLMIPYVGTVLILPIPVTYRAFTVALLDQIDPGYFSPDGVPAG